MPYPYSNDLGKKPPPGSLAARGPGYVSPQNAAKKATEEQLAVIQKHVNEMTAQMLADKQKAMMDQLFGAKPTTIKFPGVVPASIKNDFPAGHPANKWGKPDPNALPEEGPNNLYLDHKKNEVLEKWAKELMGQGVVDKIELYSKLYGANDAKYKAKVLGEFPDPVLENLKQAYESPKPTSYMGFTKQGTGLGEQDSFEIHMKFSIEGIEGLDDKILNAKQLVSKQFIYSSYGKSAQEKIVDDMLRQIKLEIMDQIKKGKG